MAISEIESKCIVCHEWVFLIEEGDEQSCPECGAVNYYADGDSLGYYWREATA